MELSVVIPLYRSEKTIALVIEEIQRELASIHIEDYEIILVNDASPDSVFAVAKELALRDKRIKVISLARNSGQGAAAMMGYRYASGKYIISMDDDYQTPGSGIGKLLNTLEKDDLDVVFARYPVQKQSKFRLFGSFVNYKMAGIMLGKPKGLFTNSFLIMRKFVCDEILRYESNYPYIFGVIFAVTSRVGNVDVEHRERLCGKSGYTFRKLLSLWLDGFLSFSIKPLRLSTLIGFLAALSAAMVAVWIIAARILWPNVNTPLGWASTNVTILFFAGVQLLSIGLLGEYVGRLYISSSKLPTAVVRETVNCEKLKTCIACQGE